MTNIAQKILDFIGGDEKTPHEIISFLEISNVATHRHLKKMIGENILEKLGTPPRVFYRAVKNSHSIRQNITHNNLIEENFTLITPTGTELMGMQGFAQWCSDRAYDVQQKISEYEKTYQEYQGIKKDGVIDASVKIQNTFTGEQRHLDHLYFLYPYSLPIFGKTKIATWLFHGKQTQNKTLMKRVIEQVVPEIQKVIIDKKYNAIAFIPPSVPRQIQFMKLLERDLKTMLPIIKIEKIKGDIIIQQKSLKDLKDRIQNAEQTMVVTGSGNYEKVLVIDDFTGSGSTLNVLASKIKSRSIAKNVDGLTITGSMNGFEIIKEV